MNYHVLRICLGLVLAGCTTRKCCDVIDTGILIRYNNAQGQDWLRTQQITEAGMEIYFLCEGKKLRVYNATRDMPKSIRLFREPDTARTSLLLGPSDCYTSASESVTLLEFPDHSVDTVRCRSNLSGGNILCTEVRYNGQPRWNSQAQQTGKGRYFTVIK
jgi:hypothetical protein